MCLIISNPKAISVPTEYIINAFSQNSDGFGVMYAKGGQLRVKRGLFTISNILEIFGDLERANMPYVAHFRFATHGTTDGKNCHPFPITTNLGGVAMVHNGVLLGDEWRAANKSDTAILAARLTKHIDRRDIKTRDLFEKNVPFVDNQYGKALGTDKLVFMNGRGDINIYNEDNGLWIDDVWYSNLYSLATPRVRVNTWRKGSWKAATTDTPVSLVPATTKIAAE